MVEQVENRTLYHVTTDMPYKRAFVANERLKIGSALNPFFGFYEGAREYSINHDGQTIQVKAIKFLKQVRDDSISGPLDLFKNIAVDVAVHYVMLCRELIMEQIRCDEFNGEPPSRQRCLYACETIEEARYWHQQIGGQGAVCELKCTGSIQRADASLLLGDSEPLSVTRERARAYWRGESGTSPEWETLFVGELLVYKVGL